MREELINKISLYIQSLIPDKSLIDVNMHLEIILNDYEIQKRETAIALRNEDMNEIMIKKFLVAKTVEGRTDRTIQYYRDRITTIVYRINKSVTEITTDDIRYYMAVRKIQDGVSDVTIGNEIRCMRSFFTFLENEELINKNPCRSIGPIKTEKVKKKAFSEMDVEKIRSACRTARESAIVEILLSTGCRVSELVGIERNDVLGESLIVHGKGKKDRTVYLNAKSQMAINNYLKERTDNSIYLFTKYKKDERANAGQIEKIVRDIGERAGVQKCHPHRFRRTCATFALRRGMPVEQVSKMLGHEELTTTQIYLDLSEEELHQAHKKYVV